LFFHTQSNCLTQPFLFFLTQLNSNLPLAAQDALEVLGASKGDTLGDPEAAVLGEVLVDALGPSVVVLLGDPEAAVLGEVVIDALGPSVAVLLGDPEAALLGEVVVDALGPSVGVLLGSPEAAVLGGVLVDALGLLDGNSEGDTLGDSESDMLGIGRGVTQSASKQQWLHHDSVGNMVQ
jgi:hypothetical protein